MRAPIITVLLALFPASPVAPAEAEIDYPALLMTYLTARNCGMDDFSATGGFRSSVLELHASGKVSASRGREIRRRVNDEFRRAWNNAGDIAGRCGSEGKAAAERLRGLLRRD